MLQIIAPLIMGVALTACGIDTHKLINKSGEHCSGLTKDGHIGHVLRAEVLANSLRNNSFKYLGSLQKISSEDFDLWLTGKTGIIFFKDYWRREYKGAKETFANRSGDHIDLWDGSKTTSAGWFRLNIVPLLHIGDWGYSNLEDSKDIWFWAVG